jgi:hypothetical protein
MGAANVFGVQDSLWAGARLRILARQRRTAIILCTTGTVAPRSGRRIVLHTVPS